MKKSRTVFTHFIKIDRGNTWHKITLKEATNLMHIYGSRLKCNYNREKGYFYHYIVH